jgi:hypothetical protein
MTNNMVTTYYTVLLVFNKLNALQEILCPCPEERRNQMINQVHLRFQHASKNELMNLLKLNINGFKGVSDQKIKTWYEEHGRLCLGCVEGKMKEHVRIKSTKPLKSISQEL